MSDAPEGPKSWRARLGRTERWVIIAVGFVLVLAVVFYARRAIETRDSRDGLIDRSRREAATIKPDEATFLDRARAHVISAAAPAYPGDAREGKLEDLVVGPGVYVRVAAADLARAGFFAEAVRESSKDAFAFCLLQPPNSTSDADVVVAATKARPGTAEFENGTGSLQRLAVVQRGLRVLTPAWADEVRAADAVGLKALAAEMDDRKPADIQAARGWTNAAYLAIVVDETPADMPLPAAGSPLAESFRASTLPAISKKAREIRAIIVDLATGKVVLRLRRKVDPPAFGKRTGVEDASAAEDCALAAAVRGTVGGEQRVPDEKAPDDKVPEPPEAPKGL